MQRVNPSPQTSARPIRCVFSALKGTDNPTALSDSGELEGGWESSPLLSYRGSRFLGVRSEPRTCKTRAPLGAQSPTLGCPIYEAQIQHHGQVPAARSWWSLRVTHCLTLPLLPGRSFCSTHVFSRWINRCLKEKWPWNQSLI